MNKTMFLKGLWGVVMNAKGVTMPYQNTNKALSLLHTYCPQSCFAYPSGGLVDEVSYITSPELDVDNGLATPHQLTMTKFEIECKEYYTRSRQEDPLLIDITIGKEVYGYDMHDANDVKFRIVANEKSIGLAYDDPPESDINRTLRVVFGLTFWQAYRDHAENMGKGDPPGN